MTGRIHDNRLLFEARIQEAVRALSPEARAAVLELVLAVQDLARRNAAESIARAKWMMHAYWKVVGVYAGHCARFIRRAGRPLHTSAIERRI